MSEIDYEMAGRKAREACACHGCVGSYAIGAATLVNPDRMRASTCIAAAIFGSIVDAERQRILDAVADAENERDRLLAVAEAAEAAAALTRDFGRPMAALREALDAWKAGRE